MSSCREDDFDDAKPEAGELLYQMVRDAPDTEAAIMALPMKEWREMHGWLLRNYQENAMSGLILGLQLVDAGRRLMQTKDEQGGVA